MYRVILENKYDYGQSFVCTVNRVTGQQLFYQDRKLRMSCLPDENVELIPLNLDEKYEFKLDSNKVLEINFR
jgi:hypothetical protein